MRLFSNFVQIIRCLREYYFPRYLISDLISDFDYNLRMLKIFDYSNYIYVSLGT